MNKTIYQIVYGVSIIIIEDKVNSMLKEGWKLRGGVATLSTHFAQAMTKTIKTCGNCLVNKTGFVKVNKDEFDTCPICNGTGGI